MCNRVRMASSVFLPMIGKLHGVVVSVVSDLKRLKTIFSVHLKAIEVSATGL